MIYLIYRGTYSEGRALVAHADSLLEAVVVVTNMNALYSHTEWSYEEVPSIDDLSRCNVCGMPCLTEYALSVHRTTMRHAWTRADNLAHQFWLALSRKYWQEREREQFVVVASGVVSLAASVSR